MGGEGERKQLFRPLVPTKINALAALRKYVHWGYVGGEGLRFTLSKKSGVKNR